MRTPDDDPELYDRALKAYYAWCDKNGYVADHPAESLCELGTKYVYLRNSNRLLAKYNLQTGRIETGD